MAGTGDYPLVNVEGLNCSIEGQVHSLGGVFTEDSTVLGHPLTRLQLQLVIIFVLTQSLHLLLRRFRVPRVCSEILAGFLLGPSFLGQISIISSTLFPEEGAIFIDILSKIGLIFFIFLTGLKMDPRILLTSSGGGGSWRAWTVGMLAVLIPFTGAAALITVMKYTEVFQIHRYYMSAVRIIVSINLLFSLPVIANLLIDLKIMNSELGRLALASTLISDLFGNLLTTIAANIKMGSGYRNGISVTSVFLLLVWSFIIYASSGPIARWIIKQTPEGKPIKGMFIILIFGAVLLVVIVTDNVGINYLYGPFLLGLAMPDGPPLGSTLADKLESLSNGLLTPLLVSSLGMKVNLVVLYDFEFIWRVWALISACLVMKFACILFPALLCKVPFKDSLSLSFIMCTQGVVQIAHYSTYATAQIFDADALSMMVSSVFVIALITQLSVKSLYDNSKIYTGYHKRDIQHLGYNAELRVVTCSQRLDDVLVVRRMLEASFSNKENPLAVYALNLVELVGRNTPILIDHKLGQKSTTGGSRSQKIIEILHQFEQQFAGSVSVHLFTAVSLPKFMHHDICSLAFDKLASFIILPFHKKWNNQGKVMLDSSSLRITNCNVCDMAPCSVGILVDRSKMRRQSTTSPVFNVAVIFIGGDDDREALSYAKRMARSPGTHLTVVRFVPWDTMANSQWDAVIDVEFLKELRMRASHQDNLVYKEERVRDGAETALHIREMEEIFDLIMVGRRHREDMPQLLGLNEWNELPELGPVGDMLADTQVTSPVSVLVVQQQIVRKR